MDITVKSLYLKTSPRKVAPALFMMRGQNAERAMISLKLTNRKASGYAADLLKSALAVAKENDLDLDKMVIKEVYCNEGPRLKRRQIKSRGRADAIVKRMSHLTIVITDNAVESPITKKQSPVKEEKKEEKAEVTIKTPKSPKKLKEEE